MSVKNSKQLGYTLLPIMLAIIIIGLTTFTLLRVQQKRFATKAETQTQATEAGKKTMQYCKPDGISLKLDLYQPSQAGPRPVVVRIHGGGWTGGTRALSGGQFKPYKDALVEAGIAVATIDYRLAAPGGKEQFGKNSQFPAQIQDVECAIKFLKSSASKYNLDPNNIGLMGESAGAHLASIVGLTKGTHYWPAPEEYPNVNLDTVKAVADLFGPTDFNAIEEYKGAEGEKQAMIIFGSTDSKIYKLYSPITYVDGSEVPFLIQHGTNDTNVPISQSRSLRDALKAKNSSNFVDLNEVKGATHGFPKGQVTDAMVKEVVTFFKKYLK